MKPIQIMMDDELLSDFDADEDVRRLGRSAVFRRIAREYLERRRRKIIADRYRRAYGGQGEALGGEFAGWEQEGVWPDD